MSGWIGALALAAIVFALALRFAKLPPAGTYLVGAAIALALFGYSLQGRPSVVSADAQPARAASAEDRGAIEVRRQMYGRFSGDAQWIDFSDTMLRIGATRAAVDAARRGLDTNPRSVPLWVALGGALVAHAQGQISPAALFAFDRAARLDPESTAPPFFLGLALANAGDGDAAIRTWFDLLKRTPPDAPWRPEIERRLGTLVLARLDATKRQASTGTPVPVPVPMPPVPVQGSGRPDAPRAATAPVDGRR